MNYKYHLLKYKGKSSRLTCPACGRPHCFTPYVDDENRIVGEEYGRCDHESSCGYIKYPSSDHTGNYQPGPRLPRPTPKPKKICTVPMSIVARTVRMQPQSDFITFLLTLFDEATVSRLVEEYFIGVTRQGDTIFYQIDIKGRCRTGKVMKYNSQTGHRIKDSNAKAPITWVHSILKRKGLLPRDWELTQCLFGEHLLKKYPDSPVCLVEAEKTAVIAAALMPQCVWVAVGGKSQLGDKIEILSGRQITAFPDVDGYETWVEKCAARSHLKIMVSDYLQKVASVEDRHNGIDIADVLLSRKFETSYIKTPLYVWKNK